jgi:hypothetical protein
MTSIIVNIILYFICIIAHTHIATGMRSCAWVKWKVIIFKKFLNYPISYLPTHTLTQFSFTFTLCKYVLILSFVCEAECRVWQKAPLMFTLKITQNILWEGINKGGNSLRIERDKNFEELLTLHVCVRVCMVNNFFMWQTFFDLNKIQNNLLLLSLLLPLWMENAHFVII